MGEKTGGREEDEEGKEGEREGERRPCKEVPVLWSLPRPCPTPAQVAALWDVIICLFRYNEALVLFGP